MNNKYEIRGEVTAIFLRKKDGSLLEALIDTEDLPLVEIGNSTWVRKNNGKKGYDYASYQIQKNKKLTRNSMHRVITNCPKGYVVDHINHNTLDNRKQNLRVTDTKGNQENRHRKDGTGVYWMKRYKKWEVRLGSQYVGRYDTKEEAIEVSKRARAQKWELSPEAQSIPVTKEEKIVREFADPYRQSRSGVRNVTYNRRTRKYTVKIRKDKKDHYCGEYSTVKEAAAVAEKMREKYFGRGA
ncbi:HNH endonuclease [Paenibacillus urinalis]|uniref:HNH endonuclease n=1 Tax=Paenibacillus urinalis TaxID=521520 RepID=UPI0019621C2A